MRPCGATGTYDTIVLEKLQVRNMTRSAKGTVQQPGRNVAAKAGLNRALPEPVSARSRSWLRRRPNAPPARSSTSIRTTARKRARNAGMLQRRIGRASGFRAWRAVMRTMRM
jgi:hypothetical protein